MLSLPPPLYFHPHTIPPLQQVSPSLPPSLPPTHTAVSGLEKEIQRLEREKKMMEEQLQQTKKGRAHLAVQVTQLVGGSVSGASLTMERMARWVATCVG